MKPFVPVCVNCIYHDSGSYMHTCKAPQTVDLVTGSPQTFECAFLRRDEKLCGRHGAWFRERGVVVK